MEQENAEELKKKRMLDNLLSDDMKEIVPYLEEPTVTDIAVVDSGEIIVTRFDRGKEFTGKYLPDFMTERIIKAAAAIHDINLDTLSGFPVLETTIPKYNARLTGLMKVTHRSEIQIRKPPENVYTLEEYLAHGQMTEGEYKQIMEAIQENKNIIVSGSTGCGKTTLTNAIVQKMTEITPDDNFYIVEDTPELQCKARMKTMLCVPKEFAWKAVEESLRFTPQRVIFGEVRRANVMRELIDAWRTTPHGGVSTFHAINGASTLMRIKGMLQKDDPETANHLSEIIQFVVHLKRDKNGVHVDEIMNVKEETDSFISELAANNLL